MAQRNREPDFSINKNGRKPRPWSFREFLRWGFEPITGVLRRHWGKAIIGTALVLGLPPLASEMTIRNWHKQAISIPEVEDSKAAFELLNKYCKSRKHAEDFLDRTAEAYKRFGVRAMPGAHRGTYHAVFMSASKEAKSQFESETMSAAQNAVEPGTKQENKRAEKAYWLRPRSSKISYPDSEEIRNPRKAKLMRLVREGHLDKFITERLKKL